MSQTLLQDKVVPKLLPYRKARAFWRVNLPNAPPEEYTQTMKTVMMILKGKIRSTVITQTTASSASLSTKMKTGSESKIKAPTHPSVISSVLSWTNTERCQTHLKASHHLTQPYSKTSDSLSTLTVSPKYSNHIYTWINLSCSLLLPFAV